MDMNIITFIDKVLGILVTVWIVTLYFADYISGTLVIVLLDIVVIFNITSFMSFCLLYYPFKISTKKFKL